MIGSMATLLEQLTAQLNSVRATPVIHTPAPAATAARESAHRPKNPALDNTIHIGPKGGRYRLSPSGRRVYL